MNSKVHPGMHGLTPQQQRRLSASQLQRQIHLAAQPPLPMTYTMHFTAINGVQPTIPQNIEETIDPADLAKEEDGDANPDVKD